MRWLHFILSHSIFIALCALALCYQTFALLHIPGNNLVYFFLFCSTLCSYNFYWLLSKYTFRGNKILSEFFLQNQSYLFLSLISASGMVISLYFLQGIFPYIVLAFVLTLLYSIPLWPFQFTRRFRNAGFLKTTL